jgi:hypothetical protein
MLRSSATPPEDEHVRADGLVGGPEPTEPRDVAEGHRFKAEIVGLIGDADRRPGTEGE